MEGRTGRSSLLLVDGLHELAYNKRYTLDALDLLLGADELPLEIPLLILDVLLLELDVSGGGRSVAVADGISEREHIL